MLVCISTMFNVIYLTLGRGGNAPPVYTVDSTDLENWNQNVCSKSLEIVQALIQVRFLRVRNCLHKLFYTGANWKLHERIVVLQSKIPAQTPATADDDDDNKPCFNSCEMCQKVFVREKEWTGDISVE